MRANPSFQNNNHSTAFARLFTVSDHFRVYKAKTEQFHYLHSQC